MRSRADVRTVVSPMSRPETTSVTVRRMSACSSRRAAMGSASASATSCSMSARWSAKASSCARWVTARCPNEARSRSTSATSSSMRSVSAYRMSLGVIKCPCTCRSSVSPATHASAPPGASPRRRRTTVATCVVAPASASAACRVSVCAVSNSASTCSAVARTCASGSCRAPRSASASQWWESATRAQAATSASYTTGRGGLGGRARDGQAVGDTAHEVGVADPGERTGAGQLSVGVGVGDVQRGPPLLPPAEDYVEAGGDFVPCSRQVPRPRRQPLGPGCRKAATVQGGTLTFRRGRVQRRRRRRRSGRTRCSHWCSGSGRRRPEPCSSDCPCSPSVCRD